MARREGIAGILVLLIAVVLSGIAGMMTYLHPLPAHPPLVDVVYRATGIDASPLFVFGVVLLASALILEMPISLLLLGRRGRQPPP